MSRLGFLAILALMLVMGCVPAYAADEISLPQSDGGHRKLGGVGDSAKFHMTTKMAGEDVGNDTLRIESQWEYEDVAASQTDQAMGATGAAGDLLHAVKCFTSAASVGAVTVKDGAGSAFTIFLAQSAAAILDSPPLDWVSVNGAWSVTTGTNTTCKVSGRFS
ncbi:MAG: hypothetical protein HQL97_00450 [Magnetococcales bacterium]|nr:hypothetical protein [Magnetococcales bacterium]